MTAADAYCRKKRLSIFVTSPSYLPLWFALGKSSELYLGKIPILKDAAYGLFSVTLLNWLLSVEIAGKWPTNRLVSWLSRVGVFSYSLYLVHQPIRMVLKPAIGRLLSADTSLGFFVAAGAVTFAGYWGAVAYFYLVEKHFLNVPSKKPDEVGQTALASRVVSGAA